MNLIDILKSLGKKSSGVWEKFYSKEEKKLEVPDKTLYDIVKESAELYPDLYAYDYYGVKTTYKVFFENIEKASVAFRNLGIRRGDVVSLCLPNIPEALISVYALNKIGAICEMIHPLSSEQEIKTYVNNTGSVLLVMVDFCYEKVKNIISETNIYKTVVVSVRNSMPFWLGLGYEITQGFKIEKPSRNGEYIYWDRFIKSARHYNLDYDSKSKATDPAIILHSGGTTGSPKSIVHSSYSFNALMTQAKILLKDVVPGDKIVGILPIFHGFGLGVVCHCAISKGVEILLLPQFDEKQYKRMIYKDKPAIFMGVPTLLEGITKFNDDNLDLSYIKWIISGGDSMSLSQLRNINAFLLSHGSKVRLIQGYGMTECLASVCGAFKEPTNKELSIGIPMPGNYMKIVKSHSHTECKPGEIGEICVSGPTLMMGYLDNEKETNEVLQMHKDGRIWLHTGDMGYMDEDGVFFYQQRLKRMLITNGFNVYPNQIENVICEHPAVLNCTVVGVPHPYKVQVAKAFIVLKKGYRPTLGVKNEIKELCKKNLAKYSQPYEYEFRESLPKTLIGKVDFKKLQDEETEKRS